VVASDEAALFQWLFDISKAALLIYKITSRHRWKGIQ